MQQHGNGALHHLRNVGVAHITAGNLEAFFIPGVTGLRIGLDPGFGLGHHLLGSVCHLFNQACGLSFRHIKASAFQQRHNGFFNAQFAHQPHNAATTGEQTQAHFRQAKLHGGRIQSHPVMTGQADFITATQCCTIYCCYHRFAQLFQLGEHALDLFAHQEQAFFVLAGFGLEHVLDIATGEKGFLGGGQHHAGDVVALFLKALDSRAH